MSGGLCWCLGWVRVRLRVLVSLLLHSATQSYSDTLGLERKLRSFAFDIVIRMESFRVIDCRQRSFLWRHHAEEVKATTEAVEKALLSCKTAQTSAGKAISTAKADIMDAETRLAQVSC